MIPVWTWWVGGIAGYLFSIGIAHSVFRRVTNWDMSDEGLLASIFWPFVSVVTAGIGLGVVCARLGSGAVDAVTALPRLAVRAYRWARRGPPELPPARSADDYRERPCPECGR